MIKSIILLTYKGKVLLINKDTLTSALDETQWYCISGIKKKNESSQKTIEREVENETQMRIKSVELLGCATEEKEKKFFYHTHLTDNDVNSMVRESGKVVSFFSPREVAKLPLSGTTKQLLEHYNDYLQSSKNE